MSQYVERGILTEFHGDTGSTSWAEKISIGTTGIFTVRTSAASALTTGFTTSSNDFTTPPWARGIEFFTSINAVTSATSGNAALTIEVRPKAIDASGTYLYGGHPSSARWIGDQLSTAYGSTMGTTGTNRLVIYPGVSFTSGYNYSGVLPQIFRVDSTLAGSSMNWTWGITARFIP